ncbi:MAG: hypothetical protein JNM93_11325 [Bacteriovoracaceae bacterium]|nr:hypothetical protein [Bacteriovoracaceae bacterium]
MNEVKGLRDENLRHQNNMEKLRDSHQTRLEKEKLEHQKQIETEKINHDYRLVDLREQQEQHVLSEIERKDKVLSELQDKVEKTKKITDRELQEIKDRHEYHRTEREEAFNNDSIKQKNDHELFVRTEEEKFDRGIREMNQRYADEEREISYRHSDNVRTTKNNNQADYQKLHTNYRIEKDSGVLKFQQDLNRLKDTHNKTLEEEKRKHTDLMQQNQNRFNNEMTTTIERHKQRKDITQKDFEKEYNRLLHEQRNVVNTLDNRTKELIVQGKQYLSKEKALLSSQAQDDFYHMNKLIPRYVDLGDSYDVYVNVPLHEKNNVNISTKNRDIKISLDRKYNETLEDDGIVNTSKKVETISTKVRVPDLIDPLAKVTKSYENGVMVFNVKKA